MSRISYQWSPELAYAIGLISTDGCLSPDGRHIDLTSKDKEQLFNFLHCMNIANKIGVKKSGRGYISYRVQFGNIKFYKFLLAIGLTPNKTRSLGSLKVPSKYFADFLRGHFDGDGSFYSYFDPRWKSSHMFYTSFVSASRQHIDWLRDVITRLFGVRGHITKSKLSSIYQLKYAKRESLKLLPKLYYHSRVICLSRKRDKIERVVNNADVAKLATALP